MARRLLITFGTSLFYSASWRNEGPFTAIEDYNKWLRPECLVDPQARRSWIGNASGFSIEDTIRQLIFKNPESPAIVGNFDVSFTAAGRYSAEVSTLLAMRLKLNRHRDVMAFLADYERIVLVHGGTQDDPSCAAARHLAAVLRPHLNRDTIELKGIEGGSIGQQLTNLIKFLEGLDRAPTDLVTTGGYKAFSVVLGHMYWQHAHDDWRLFYLHESDMGELIQEWGSRDGRQIEVGGVRISYREGHLL